MDRNKPSFLSQLILDATILVLVAGYWLFVTEEKCRHYLFGRQ